MLGWKLFAKAVTLITDNLGLALRVSLVPYGIALAAALLLGGAGLASVAALDPTDAAAMEAALGGAALLGLFAIVAIFVVASLWVAVAWHRATLLEEPTGWVPPFHGGPMLGYLGRSLLLGLVLMVAYLAIGLVAGLLGALVPPLAILVLLAGIVALVVVFYRLAVILPAGAVGRPVAFGEAWSATSGASGAILLVAVLTVALSLLLQLPTLLVGGGLGAVGDPAAAAVATGGVISLVYGVVVQWIMLMVGISVLTVLYGHFVEDRPL
ncbi:hypothetical protein JQC91_03035 [Jannaschia sp. Os4]|uniref:hypothetical protein n=1 Tax=Jannaschia sp. Os4 TaxID=2807617 RepID=UPI00193ACD02|nr:hypothetical protein [Jannaschia sp. Os4]MBM2575270.1 hypothetical protein [Jannaschia sp. Os4]